MNEPEYLKQDGGEQSSKKINKGLSDEAIGRAVKTTAKVAVASFLLFTIYLGLLSLGNRLKSVFYRDRLEGLQGFSNTCEVANTVNGGCKELASVVENKLDWHCRPDEKNKTKAVCEIKIKEVKNEND